MSENEQPTAPPPQPPALAERPAGRIPFTQEFDRGRRTMPAALPVVIAFAAVAIVVAVIVFFNRSKPSAAGTMTKVASAAIQDDSVMVAIQIKFDNTTGERLWIKSIKSELETADGQKYSDDAAPSSDMDRYLQAFPILAESRAGALQEEMKIPPRGALEGMIVVSFPVSKAAFDARKALRVQMGFYDHPGMVITQ